jgi:HPt (histidine-containing phosphotransfer) domain-containing protein
MSDDHEKRFAELRVRYERSLPEKRETAERAWHAFLDAPDERGVLELQSIAHKLAGSAAPYGYAAVGSAAQAIDALLSEWLKRDSTERESVRALATQVAAPAQMLLDRLAHAIETASGSA